MCSREDDFVWDGLDRAKLTVIPPSIDVFSPKNHATSFTAGDPLVLRAPASCDHGHRRARACSRARRHHRAVDPRSSSVEVAPLAPTRRCSSRSPRWDRLKDPSGIVTAFADDIHDRIPMHTCCSPGPTSTSVADDPEGLTSTHRDRSVRGTSGAGRRTVHCALPMVDVDENAVIVNAVQRAPSRRAEEPGGGVRPHRRRGDVERQAGRRGRIGGIREQIVDGVSGVLIRTRATYGCSAIRSSPCSRIPRRRSGSGSQPVNEYATISWTAPPDALLRLDRAAVRDARRALSEDTAVSAPS